MHRPSDLHIPSHISSICSHNRPLLVQLRHCSRAEVWCAQDRVMSQSREALLPSPFSFGCSRPFSRRNAFTSMEPFRCSMTPCSVIMPVISREGVTSKAGFHTCPTPRAEQPLRPSFYKHATWTAQQAACRQGETKLAPLCHQACNLMGALHNHRKQHSSHEALSLSMPAHWAQLSAGTNCLPACHTRSTELCKPTWRKIGAAH